MKMTLTSMAFLPGWLNSRNLLVYSTAKSMNLVAEQTVEKISACEQCINLVGPTSIPSKYDVLSKEIFLVNLRSLIQAIWMSIHFDHSLYRAHTSTFQDSYPCWNSTSSRVFSASSQQECKNGGWSTLSQIECWHSWWGNCDGRVKEKWDGSC